MAARRAPSRPKGWTVHGYDEHPMSPDGKYVTVNERLNGIFPQARGAIEVRQELELGLRGHLIGLVHQDNTESPARRAVSAARLRATCCGRAQGLG